ncbi:NADH-quinone oxidoreductase subunit L [Candidatus Sumerlaeota bacterium]|nr:NADH-quinone oxidoreductase subunit L [Candidatus Sumerlaeota bacterium]
MNILAALIPVFPLLGFAFIILNGKRLGERAPIVAVGASLISAVIALFAYTRVLATHTPLSWSFEWIAWGEGAIRMGVHIDGVGAVMLFMVTVVGTLIEIYAIGYMKGDYYYSRFFAYMSLFMAGMLGMVVADNMLLLFVSWEIMGLCSYFLIGFYTAKPSANAAGIKAFLTTRLGDVGLMMGIFLLWWTAGTINFEELGLVVPQLQMLGMDHLTLALTIAAVLIFVGTIGKSAQFPLHVWLPDAMEGPTPVSALIHAATMVAAGVFLVARTFMVFVNFPDALELVAVVGGFTALFAALIALTQTDIKRVLAYSTLSQLGYMVMALGLGAYAAGIFHLITHAFFKALLFMGAGAVIHGYHHVQDIRRMGGLRHSMPRTHISFLVATLAIAGCPLFSGFWSKDEILLAAFHGNRILWGVGTFTAFLTAFYMFRLYLLTFTGRQRDTAIRPHESPRVMTTPLLILAVFAFGIGFPGSPLMHFWVQGAIHPSYLPHTEHAVNLGIMGISTAAALLGFVLAVLMYGPSPKILPERVAAGFGKLYQLSLHKFYIDEIYQSVIIAPTVGLARLLFGFDQGAIDGSVNGTGRGVRLISGAARWLTAGNLQWYAITFLAGAVGLALIALRALAG